MPCLSARPGARTDLHFIAFGNRDGEAGRDRVALAGSKRHVLGGNHVEPGRAVGRVTRRWQTLAVRQPLQLDLDHFAFFRAGLRPPFLRRALGRALIDQPHGFVQRHRLRVRALGQGRVGRAVADVGTVAAGHHLDLLAARRMRAEHRDRLARRAALASGARRGIGELGDRRVHARLEHLGGRVQLRIFAVVGEVRAVAPDRRGDRLAGLGMRADLARQRQQPLGHFGRHVLERHVLGDRRALVAALDDRARSGRS